MLPDRDVFFVRDFFKTEDTSMKKTEDRRIQKTRTLLSEALISLILEKDYEVITVQEILDRANVGRSTFYTHFSDKDELLLNGLDNLREMLRSAQDKTPLVAAKPYEKIIGFSLAMFEHAYEYRGVWRALLGSKTGAVVRQHILKIVADLIRDEGKEFLKRKRVDPEIPVELFVHFLASTFMSTLSWWLNQKNPVPPKKMDAVFRALIMPVITSNPG